jgi:hypothetical protein
MLRSLTGLFATAFVTIALPVIAQDAPATEDDFNPTVVTVTGPGSLRELADKAGYKGSAQAEYLFVVPQGVNIMGAPGGKNGRPDGGHALVSGQWPEDAEIWLLVRGNVYGGGGRGGNGGTPASTDGGKGGDAIVAQVPMTITVLKTGSMKAGGGGGAGAEAGPGLGGSGGGGGFPNGEPGSGGSPEPSSDGMFTGGDWGRAGTPAGGGLSGRRGNPGGRGGDAAMPGESATRTGGAAGNAVRKNGFEVVILSGGQIYGESY